MTAGTERFTIRVMDEGVLIRDGEGNALRFTPSEALMILDILKHEEESLTRMARESSPVPFQICFRKGETGVRK
jgi:hypothetical protein